MHSETPNALLGMDVTIGPRVGLAGEGARRHPNFGNTIRGAVESALVSDGFDVVGGNKKAVRVELSADLSVSRSSLFLVNGKPLESDEARVTVRLLSADGALLDSFSVEGDPGDSGLSSEVADTLLERMKGSRRLLAMAKTAGGDDAAPGAPAKPPVLAAKAVQGSRAAATPQATPSPWPDVARPVKGQSDGAKDAAVIVGVEDYAELTDVPGARANAEAWFQYLLESRGVPRGNITMLLDQQARDKQILAAVKHAATQAKAGGKLWFVFIGHGAPNRSQEGMLVGFDAYQTADGLEDRSVRIDSVLYALRSTAATPVVLLDACFSGRAAGGETLVAGLQPSMVVKNAPVGDALVLTAAMSNQFAGPLPGARRPAFSYLALGALRGWADRDENGVVSAAEVENYVGDTMRVLLAGQRQQTPTLEGDRRNLSLSRATEKEPGAVQRLLRGQAR